MKQLLIRVSRVRKEGHLRMWSYMSGSEGVIMVEDFHPDETFMDVTAAMSPARAISSGTIPAQAGRPAPLSGDVPDMGGRAVPDQRPLGKGGQEREDRVNGGFIVSYSPEYLKFTSNYEALREIVSTTKGQELTPAATKEEIYGRREPKSSSQPIFDWLLYGLAILIPIDVGLRRVQLDWSVIKGWLGFGRKQETTATMGALLKRKESVGSQLKTRSERPIRSQADGAAKLSVARVRRRECGRMRRRTPSTPSKSGGTVSALRIDDEPPAGHEAQASGRRRREEVIR